MSNTNERLTSIDGKLDDLGDRVTKLETRGHNSRAGDMAPEDALESTGESVRSPLGLWRALGVLGTVLVGLGGILAGIWKALGLHISGVPK